jgi:hypothetical protein
LKDARDFHFSSSVLQIATSKLDQGLIQTVQARGLHFSSTVQKLRPPTLNQGSGFDSNSVRGALHFSSSVSEFKATKLGPRFDSKSARGWFTFF